MIISAATESTCDNIEHVFLIKTLFNKRTINGNLLGVTEVARGQPTAHATPGAKD